ncbi:MAG: hypothetical protein H7257_06240 [Taibaiella sp.]|nr:hypothetical protein [Taibaiella sp.]
MRLLKVAVAAGIMVTAGASAIAQTADEVIQKHIEAVGGTKKWDAVKTIKLTGSISQGGMEINMTQTVANDKGMRTDIEAMGQKGYIIITPTQGWMYMPFAGQTKPEALPADQLKASQDKLNFRNTQLVDQSMIAKTVMQGTDTINKVPCYKIKVTGKDGNESVCYFDSKDYYMVRTEVKVKIQDEERETYITYSNFKKQPQGIVIPMTMGTEQGDVNFKTVEINKPVDEKIFTP